MQNFKIQAPFLELFAKSKQPMPYKLRIGSLNLKKQREVKAFLETFWLSQKAEILWNVGSVSFQTSFWHPDPTGMVSSGKAHLWLP